MRLEVTEAAEDLLSGPEVSHHALAELEGGLSLLLTGDEARPGDTVEVDVRDGRLVCTLARTDVQAAESAAEGEGMPPPPGNGS